MAETSSSGLFVQLIEAADAIDRGDHAGAQRLLDDLLARVDAADPLERVGRMFAGALAARVQGDLSGIGNLYERVSGGDMLAAYQVLADATPIVRFGHEGANAALVEALPGEDGLLLVDVGIGSGVQWHLLFDRLAEAPSRWRHLRLVGIDLPAGGDVLGRLQAVGRGLAARAAALRLPFEFVPVVAFVQDLDFAPLAAPRPGERVAVNAALSLHHVPDTDRSGARDEVLARIRALRPSVVTLAEPDVEHNALPFRTRFVEALLHYLTVFDALDANLREHPEERATLEHAFFGREILNIVTGEGADRVERHERREAWVARFRRHGFVPLDLRRLAADLAARVRLTTSWEMAVEAEAAVLTWRKQPILAVSAWHPSET